MALLGWDLPPEVYVHTVARHEYQYSARYHFRSIKNITNAEHGPYLISLHYRYITHLHHPSSHI